ncbi:AAA family ATPase [Bernardetia sp. OM2101]|uniref:AAA family ATPase n=1 Tax=Bernardetia sp. OM2101 TaxID=3344876 RepID=UPI0035CEBB42
MILTIKNLGTLKEAEIDLSKDLILLCGHNNTGKTYVAYAIYYFLENDSALEYDELVETSKSVLFNFKQEDIISQSKNLISLDLIGFINSNHSFIEKLIIDKKKAFHKYVFPQKNLNPNFRYKIPQGNSLEKIVLGKETSIVVIGSTNISKKNNSKELRIESSIHKSASDFINSIKDGKLINSFIKILLYDILGFKSENCIYLFSSERAAINIFSKELALNKNQFFDKILKTKGEERNKLLHFAEENINRYQKPIADELLIAEDLLHLQNRKSDFEFLAIELEKSILEGKISVGQYGGLQYQPNNSSENTILEIYQTSSLVKSLASLVFYLRHLAKKNDCIIIDEPELNLHPDNQILVARFLARLVNEGFKVVASTHSDYIIRELSNLLMLSNNFKEKEELMKTYGYNENELLKNENVGVYYFEKGKNTAVSVPLLKRGIEIDSIDLVIANLNERSDDIYYTFLESDENKKAEKEEAKKAEENLRSKSKI